MGDVPVSQMSNAMTEILEQIKEMVVKNMDILQEPIFRAHREAARTSNHGRDH